MIHQYGVLAWKLGKEGEPRVLLITSRDTRRWVVPRGNPMRGLAPHEAAAEEAWEEAGVRGPVPAQALGTYRYMKERKNGSVEAEVTLYPMRVSAQIDDWPERSERTRRWFSLSEAAEMVHEVGLAELILKASEHFSREMRGAHG